MYNLGFYGSVETVKSFDMIKVNVEYVCDIIARWKIKALSN